MDTLSLSDFEDIRISVPWGHVAGRWYGNRKVRPILALHGWLDNIGTWDTLIPLMPAHVGILCIDLPGHGQSSKYPKGTLYHAIDYVHIIIKVKEEYNWKKVSLMGHSMGGVVCFIYTSIYPKSVDLIIQFDIIKSAYRSANYLIDYFALSIEKTIIEDERVDNLALQEPPSYTYEELERKLYEGSEKSIDMENCKYLLNRSITKSAKYPDKYYFARDGKVKYYREFFTNPELAAEMANRIRNVPYFIVKGLRSPKYITPAINPIIEILRKRNPHFEFHTVDGTHHLHLNNAKDVAAVLNPFLNRHRPMALNSWSIDDDNTKNQRNNGAKKEKKITKVSPKKKSKL